MTIQVTDYTWAGLRSTFANIGTKKNLCLKMSSFITHDIDFCKLQYLFFAGKLLERFSDVVRYDNTQC